MSAVLGSLSGGHFFPLRLGREASLLLFLQAVTLGPGAFLGHFGQPGGHFFPVSSVLPFVLTDRAGGVFAVLLQNCLRGVTPAVWRGRCVPRRPAQDPSQLSLVNLPAARSPSCSPPGPSSPGSPPCPCPNTGLVVWARLLKAGPHLLVGSPCSRGY